jgi:hypothetical protein
MRHFLLIYDIDQGRLAEPPREFRHSERAHALEEYARLETLHRGTRVQVVLIAADSLDAVKVTHANFFVRDSIEALLRDAMEQAGALN